MEKQDFLTSPVQVSRQLNLSLSRVTTAVTGPNVYVYATVRVMLQDGTWVSQSGGDAPIGTPSIASMDSLPRLLPGINYTCEVSVSIGGDQPAVPIAVSVDLLELDTNVAATARDVIAAAESDLSVNAIAFGISEATITTLLSSKFTAPTIQIGKDATLTMELGLENSESSTWPFLRIDVDSNAFIVTGALRLYFRPKNPGNFDTSAVVRAVIRVYCHPAMVTTTNDTLQLQFTRAEILEPSISFEIYEESGILQAFDSMADFQAEVKYQLSQISLATGPLGFALPAYLASRSMPDNWSHVQNMELDFKRFDYRKVTTHEITVSYLFIVFSVRSLDLPLPCYCEGEWPAPTLLPLTVRKIQGASSDAEEEQSSSSLRNATQPVVDPGLIAGMENKTFVSQFKPWLAPQPEQLAIQLHQLTLLPSKRLPNSLHLGSVRTLSARSPGRGTIYVSARLWYQVKLETAEIVVDGIRAVADVVAQASAKAAIRDKCGHDVVSGSARLRVKVDDTSIKWAMNIFEEATEPHALVVLAKADARVGEITITFDGSLNPPPPLDRVDDWILSTIANNFRPTLNKLATEKATVRLSRQIQSNGLIKLSMVDDLYFAGQAAVVLGMMKEIYDG